MSNQEQLQLQANLGSFESELNRYKPKDMINFCTEYFKCLQENKPLNFSDLSGLDKFSLKPEDIEIVTRLNIPNEDLLRVKNRRKIKTKEEKRAELTKEISTFNSKDGTNEEEMRKYLKFKKNSFQNNEFLRFISTLDDVSVSTEENRIFFTKVFNLIPEEKEIVFNFLECDWNLRKVQSIREWKHTLTKLENDQKHSYHLYDNVSNKLEVYVDQLEKKETINYTEAEEVYKNYVPAIDELKEMEESKLYDFLISKAQYERVIYYDMVKIKYLYEKNEDLKDLYEKIDTIYQNNFSRLTNFDFYDYVLNCFIPLIKISNKTSIEHREMESFLNKFMDTIPHFIHINFYEEKMLYYDIECVKYFLSKQNKIKESKQILIDIIKMFIEQVEYLTKVKKIPLAKLRPDFELLNLKLVEFYKPIIDFIRKMVTMVSGRKIDEKSKSILSSLLSEYKSYSKIDQLLIVLTLKVYKLNETNEEKSINLENIFQLLVQTFSISELSANIRNSTESIEKIVSKQSADYYKRLIKTPQFNFKNIQYIPFKNQAEVISLIISRRKNLKTTALTYEKNHIVPNEKYHFMIEELYNFTNVSYKLRFEKEMKEQIEKDAQRLVSKFESNFSELKAYIVNDNKNNIEDYDIEKFQSFTQFEQKLILTYMNFSDFYFIDNKYINIISKLSCVYLKDKVNYIKNKIIAEKNINNNILYIEFIYDELKHVNYPIYIYVKYDQSYDFLTSFDSEQQEIISIIMKTINVKNSFELPKCLSYEKLLQEEHSIVESQIKEYHPLVNEYVNLYSTQEMDNNVADFAFFSKDEKELIIKFLDDNQQDTSLLKENIKKNPDLGYFTYKKIILCECDDKADDDIKIYYRKILLELSQKLSNSKTNFISCVIDYPYDPNNSYIYQNFTSFSKDEKVLILQEVLARMKIMNYATLYFDNLVHLLIPEILNQLVPYIKAHNDNIVIKDYVIKEFLYLLNFFRKSVFIFIKEVILADNQTIFKFTKNFSDKERDSIVNLLELVGYLEKSSKYVAVQEELKNYLVDLKYEDKLNDINNKLDLLLKNEINKNIFFIVSQEIKESIYEIDYIIEHLYEGEPDKAEIASFLFTIYSSLNEIQRDILIKTIICINEQGNNENLQKYKEEFEKRKDEPVTASLMVYVKAAFEKIRADLQIVDDSEKEQLREGYMKLKETLNGLCGDLFEFCNECGNGYVSMRKLIGISMEKVDIVKAVLECEYCFTRKGGLKKALDYIKQIKFE